jgi:hypothetical protein
MKILNLYSGLGGNRKLWGNEHQITAVEHDPLIAAIYQDQFPNDEVIVTDAHEYLLDNYKNFDFIWSSPPCPTHSSFRFNIDVRYRGTKAEYPDMSLYQEIILLKHHFASYKGITFGLILQLSQKNLNQTIYEELRYLTYSYYMELIYLITKYQKSENY